MKLVMVRHGESMGNVDPTAYKDDNRNFLSPHGEIQAQLCGSFLRKNNHTFDRVISSNLTRAVIQLCTNGLSIKEQSMVTKYRLAHQVDSMPAGTVVYKLAYHDYGLASQDTRVYKTEYVSVTFKEDGDYPSFTVPRSALVEIAK